MQPDRQSRLVARLVTQTIAGAITWTTHSNKLRAEACGLVFFLLNEYDGERIWLEVMGKDADDQAVERIRSRSARRMPILEDLYRAARRSVTSLDAKIDAFLSE